MDGLVISDGKVLYKFSTELPPTLVEGEEIYLHKDINGIVVGSTASPIGDGDFVFEPPPLEPVVLSDIEKVVEYAKEQGWI